MLNYEVVEREEMLVVGVSAETGNSDPKMSEVIGGLWQRLYGEGLSETVKNRVNNFAIGLYSDYRGDRYLVTAGHQVSKADNPELSVKIIPAGRYAKFSLRGHMQHAVAQAWQEIWAMSLDRSFTGDYEEYLGGSVEDAEIAIYVALK